MKFDNINESLDKLLHSKKIMLLIPGVIVVVIALVLLVFAVLGVTPENGNQEQVLIETRDTIMSELVQAREYLSQLEESISDNWKVLKQDDFATDLNEMTLLSQYESLKLKLFTINEELYGYIENNENLNEETKRILLAIVSSLVNIRDEMEMSYDEFGKRLEFINNNHQGGNLEIQNWLLSLNEETTDINNNFTKSVSELKTFIDLMNLQQQLTQNEDMEIINQWFSEIINIADGDRDVINQWFSEIINIADGDRDVINQWFNEMVNIADGDRDVINQWFNEMVNIADNDRDVINQWFNEIINIADGDRDVINQWFNEMVNIAEGDREVINQWFADMINIANDDREAIVYWFSELTKFIENDIGELTRSLETESFKLQGLFIDKVSGLTDDLGLLKKQIEFAKTTINDLLGMMDLDQDKRQSEIMESFEMVNDTLVVIKNDYLKVYDKIINMHQELKEEASGHHDELLDILGGMIDQMEGDNKNTMQALIDSMDQLNQLNIETIEIMNVLNLSYEKLDNMNNMNQESFTRLGDTIDERIDGLADAIGGSNENLEKYLSGRLSDLHILTNSLFEHVDSSIGEMEASFLREINKQVDALIPELRKVFQQVANGKELLAATLAAKGQPVAFENKEYPDFDDIDEAIKALETTILVNEMPGNIEYTLHFHTILDDGDTTSENEFSLNVPERIAGIAGGCFHVPRTHNHTGSTTTGGGCHGQRNQHTHTTACNWNCPGESRLRYNTECNGASFNVSRETRNHICGRGNGVETWNNPCGGSTGHCKTAARGVWRAWGSDNCIYIGCGLDTRVSWSLNCGKTESTIEAMLLGCGYVWKQIVKATITW